MTDEANAGGDTTVAGGQDGAENTVAGGDSTVAGGADNGNEKNWRDEIAGDDEKYRKHLEKFPSVKELAKSQRDYEAKLRSGEFKPVLKEGADEKEVAAWRKANGIPETPDKYEIKLADGYVIGEQDKELVNTFLGEMHKENATPATINAALNAYYKIVENFNRDVAGHDADMRKKCEDTLRAEWGVDYRQNENINGNFLAGESEEFKTKLLGARTQDGHLLKDDPDLLRWINKQAREAGAGGALVPGQSGDPVKSINDRITELKALMNKDINAWHKNTAGKAELDKMLELQTRHGKAA